MWKLGNARSSLLIDSGWLWIWSPFDIWHLARCAQEEKNADSDQKRSGIQETKLIVV